jgi:hypothetical protein
MVADLCELPLCLQCDVLDLAVDRDSGESVELDHHFSMLGS